MYKTEHTCRAIAMATETVAGMPFGTVMGRSKVREITRPRFLAIYIMREVTGLGYKRIGGIVNRDHTTVMNAISRAEERLKIDPEYRRTKKEIEKLAQTIAKFDFEWTKPPMFKSVRGNNT